MAQEQRQPAQDRRESSEDERRRGGRRDRRRRSARRQLDDDVDAILDEIDEVLETNAEDFVRGRSSRRAASEPADAADGVRGCRRPS